MIDLISHSPNRVRIHLSALAHNLNQVRELIESKTTGFGIACLSTLRPYWSGKPAFVHPGRGERILAGTDEQEMLFSFPAKDLEMLADGLEKTHQKGTRYPVQSYMIYQPPVIPPVKALEEKLSIAF